jgi:hypothetical protein
MWSAWYVIAGVFREEMYNPSSPEAAMEVWVNGEKFTTPSERQAGSGIGFDTWSTMEYYINFHRAWNMKGFSLISVVLIYSRDLTDSELLSISRNPWNPPRSGLVLWYIAHPDYVKDIDGDGVLEWIDLSGNNNHGKIYGARLVDLFKQPVRVLARAR